jgi:hypothetical protein
MRRSLALLLLVFGAACGSPGAIVDCGSADGVTPICGFENPEDLAPLPGASWIVVSQFPGFEGGAGSLVAYRVTDGRKLTLFPGGKAAPQEGGGWGAPECPGPPDPATFAPHGIDVDLRGRRLAAVVHGAREAVELFEIRRLRRGLALTWRGCVPAPPGVAQNDVALLPGGGFVVTRMFSLGGVSQLLSQARMVAGLTSGNLLEWDRERGFREVPQSEGRGPNGVAVSPSGREIFFAEWTGSAIVRLRRDDDGSVDRAVAPLPHHPDNLTWTRDGRLLVTGQVGRIGDLLGCGATERGTCALPFSVVLVDPATLDYTVVLEHAATAQGAGTTALQVADEILIGTYDGDRLARAEFRP